MDDPTRQALLWHKSLLEEIINRISLLEHQVRMMQADLDADAPAPAGYRRVDRGGGSSPGAA